jgi:hypothetical protein
MFNGYRPASADFSKEERSQILSGNEYEHRRLRWKPGYWSGR